MYHWAVSLQQHFLVLVPPDQHHHLAGDTETSGLYLLFSLLTVQRLFAYISYCRHQLSNVHRTVCNRSFLKHAMAPEIYLEQAWKSCP